MVDVVDYRPEWPARFAVEESRLRAAAGTAIVAWEHIGSTAVPGLSAKPIIDIAARCALEVDPFSLASRFAGSGYAPHRAG